METVTLADILTIVTTYGASEVAFWLVEKVPALSLLPSDIKRYTALAIAFVVAVLAWLAQIGMAYVAQPVGVREWIAGVFAVGATAAGLGQIIHARRVLRNR